MELLLVFIPVIIVPIGLSIAGLWWLLSDEDEQEHDPYAEPDEFGSDGGF